MSVNVWSAENKQWLSGQLLTQIYQVNHTVGNASIGQKNELFLIFLCLEMSLRKEQMGSITLVYGDCMDYMCGLPDKSFDLAVVDPPYFSGPELRGYYGKRESNIGVSRIYRRSEKWIVPNEDYFAELERIAVKYVVWGCNYFNYIFAHGRIVWDKCNGSSSFSDCEIAATNLFDSVRQFRFMWNGMCQGKSIEEGHIMQGNKALNEKRIHPTQKPVALYKWLLGKYARPGDRILDTHLGSGSSAIAAHDLGFDFTGIEIDQYYYDAAKHRIQEHQRQLKLF